MATLPNGVIEDPVSGNYLYRGVVIASQASVTEVQKVVTAVDSGQSTSYTITDPVTGNPLSFNVNPANVSDASTTQYNTLLAKQQTNQAATVGDTASNQLANNPVPQAADANTTSTPSPGSTATPAETLSATEQTNLSNTTPPPGTTTETTGPAISESAFGPNAVNYDFSKMTPAEIAATGKIGASQYAANTTPSNPDAVTSVGNAPIPNRLHEYPSYTYGVSLHGLTIDQYNSVVQDQKYSPANVFIASAGRYSSDFPRNEYFADDFYFENFEMTTIIAPNDMSRNSNAADISFTIIEPYGFTLIERIIQYANSVKAGNYLDMPYLIQLDFFAIDESGAIKGSIEALRKRIPIKLGKMEVKVSTRGAEYTITAYPFNHSAYDVNSVSTPANFEVVGSSVGDFFTSAEDAQTTAQANSAVQREVTAAQAKPVNSAETVATSPFKTTGTAGQVAPNFSVPSNFSASSGTYTKVKSYGSAINAWNLALMNAGKQDTADVYKFDIHPDIASRGFTKPTSVDPKQTPMKDQTNTDDQVKMRRAAQPDSEVATYDNSQVIFQVQAGTTIEKILEHIIRNSDYIQEQIIVPEDPNYATQKEKYKNLPLQWFKIIPIVVLKSFDNIKNVWQREITYSVQPYKIYNLRSDIGPQGVQVYPVKAYNYMYTGLNDDILDFDINFNALYYNQVTAFRDSLTNITNTADASTVQKQTNDNGYTSNPDTVAQQANSVMPIVRKNVVQNSQQGATGGATTAKEVGSLDLVDSIMTSNQSDMLNLKLRIIGDPDYIKQDDIFYKPNNNINLAPTPTVDPRLIAGGSLIMDEGVLYVQVLFRVPTDLDESTGLMKYDSKYKHSIFSGLYMLLQVRNILSQGKFEQELDLVRCPRQQSFDYVNGQPNTNSDNRKPATIQQNPGIIPAAPIPTILVSGGNKPPSTANASDTGNTTTGQEQPVAIAQATTPPPADQTAADLAEINATAPTADISAQNQPQTSTLPPAA